MFTFFRWLIVGMFLLFLFSQIVWPTLKGRPMFPMFRREAELRNELAKARQRRYERNLEREIRETDADIYVPPQQSNQSETPSFEEGSNK
jgi:hypothetical protein